MRGGWRGFDGKVCMFLRDRAYFSLGLEWLYVNLTGKCACFKGLCILSGVKITD